MQGCIFCNIVGRKSPATFLYEDDKVAVIETIEPVSKGHVLVIPKQHFMNILDIDTEILGKVSAVAKEVAIKLVSQNEAKGVNILHAAGKVAQQSVFHFHFHVVPRYENDNLDLWLRNKL